MAEFRYEALDIEGKSRAGRISAPSPEAARAELLDKRLFATRLDPLTAAEPVLAGGGARLKPAALSLFTRQLATLAAVTPLEEALRTIVRQTEAPKARVVLTTVHGAVVEGRRLSDAMALEGASFPPLYRAMIAAGEGAGTLPQILERLAALLDRQAELKGRVQAALAYPAALAAVATLAVAALMIFVVPRIAEQFVDIGQTLPLLTRIVMAISGVLAAGWWAILLILAGGALIAHRALQDEALRRRFDAWLLALPLVGRLLRDWQAARLARTLAMMVASRLPLVDGLKLTLPTIGNREVRARVARMADDISEGASLTSAMRRAAILPPLLVAMAAGGESAGRLDVMLEKGAEALEREYDALTRSALALLEPAIILAMGGAVAVIVLSILLPILQLESLAQP
ncbi:type II secretion system F family protein [Sandarakinorhabdus oryzae]|uniref:type II secretion system F family protein n=1 Tax=Sandarakinorhabdus oryzae TaxID=2675220 RepID=UPI0012E13FB0|nr:type II secretion system F family protein [Sandarakinorhabdus oryzae]